MNTEKKQRYLGLDYLRIFSMLLIILLHSIDHSGVDHAWIPGTFSYYAENYLFIITKVCVNCFVMISGYFLVQSKFTIKKLIVLWIEVVFYSLIIKIVCIATGNISFLPVSLISCLFPFITGRYWFVTIYFGMYILSPFYNIAIKAMNQKQHFALVTLSVFLFSGMISLHPSLKGMNSGNGWGLAWFTVLYFTAAYFRLYYKPENKKKSYPIISLLLFIACPTVTAICLFTARHLNIQLLVTIFNNWVRYDSLPVYIATIAVFVFFIHLPDSKKQKWTSLISKISVSTFGVYLIHAHADICTEEFWQKLGFIKFLPNNWFPLYQISIVILIFVICIIIDYFRQLLFKFIKVDTIIEYILKILKKNIENIKSKFIKRVT